MHRPAQISFARTCRSLGAAFAPTVTCNCAQFRLPKSCRNHDIKMTRIWFISSILVFSVNVRKMTKFTRIRESATRRGKATSSSVQCTHFAGVK